MRSEDDYVNAKQFYQVLRNQGEYKHAHKHICHSCSIKRLETLPWHL
jgi:hypothetical protein